MSAQNEQIQKLADLLREQQRERIARQHSQEQADHEDTRVVHGSKYAKVDVGSYGQWSGRLMVEYATGVIYGIKGYGQVHKGHRYGTLDTVADWNWGEFYPIKAKTTAPKTEAEDGTLPLDTPARKTVEIDTADLIAMIERAQEAMEGDSGDAEHDALLELVEFGESLLS